MAGGTLALGVATSALLLLTSGCPLDERTLHELPDGGAGDTNSGGEAGAGDTDSAGSGASATSDSGGTCGTPSGVGVGPNGTGGATSGGSCNTTSSGGNGGSSVASSSSAGGEAGAGASSGMPTCPDLDGNAVTDCSETLVDNAGFESDVASWDQEDGVSTSWQGVDGTEHTASGSLSVTNATSIEGREGTVIRGVRQCVPAEAETTYLFLAQVQVAAGQAQGWGGINVWFYDEPDCQGAVQSSLTPLLGTTLGWSRTQVIAEAPANAKSMLVRLVVSKYFASPPVSVEFDNVLVHPE